jgi:hypothetical protein
LNTGIPLPRIAKERDILYARSVFHREQISMLRSLGLRADSNAFQCFAADREQIPIHRSHGPRAHFKAVGLAPRLLVLGWLVSKNGEKTFKI